MTVVNITQDVAVKFLQSIIFRVDVPWVLVDNGTQFKGEKFVRCANFGIEHQVSSVAHP
jgi:transposase InsO family protein